MRKIVVASHSLLAQGFKDTLEFLTGKSDAVNAVCAYVNDNGEGLDAAVEAALSGTDEVALVDEARQQIVYVNGASSAECEDDE